MSLTRRKVAGLLDAVAATAAFVAVVGRHHDPSALLAEVVAVAAGEAAAAVRANVGSC